MKLIKGTREKISNMSIPAAMLLSGLIVGLSVFLTTWVFFGGDNNRQKLSVQNPALNKSAQQANQLTPQQIQQMQQQRAQQMQQASSTQPAPTPAPTTAPKAPAPVKK